jgi:hypothetical protein
MHDVEERKQAERNVVDSEGGSHSIDSTTPSFTFSSRVTTASLISGDPYSFTQSHTRDSTQTLSVTQHIVPK